MIKMCSMKSYTNKHIQVYIKDGIMRVDYETDIITREMIEDMIINRLRLFSDKDYLMLSDIRKTKHFTREARERLSKEDGGKYVKAVGILVNSKMQEVIYNFFATINKAPAPARLFTSEVKAIEWLRKIDKEQ